MSSKYHIVIKLSDEEINDLINAHWYHIAHAEEDEQMDEVAWRKLRIRLLAEARKVS